MEFSPVISIITVVRNDREHIAATIDSVLGQKYKNIQYIIIDGNSTDGTVDIIKGYGGRIHYFVSEADEGIYDAMNKGLRAVTGDYVLFLNSADRLYDEITLGKIIAYGEADIYYGDTAFYDKDDRFLGLRSKVTTRSLPEHLSYRHFLMGMPVSHQAIIVRASLTEDFELKYFCSADIDWCIRMLKKSKSIINTGLVISKYLIGGISHQHKRTCWKERFQIMSYYFGFPLACVNLVKIIIRFLYKGILMGRKY